MRWDENWRSVTSIAGAVATPSPSSKHAICYNPPMSTNRDQFVIDESGNKTAVLVRIDRYSELLEAQEELEAIRAYDEAKASNDEAIPFAQAIKEIEGE
jgi:hypothetical protein